MLKKKDRYNVAIVGATGAVGQEMREILEERNFPVDQVRMLASERSEGTTVEFAGQEVPVQRTTKESFEGIDIALFSAGATRSLEFAPHAVVAGAVVIDNSSAFRMEEKAPLVVPEVNAHALEGHRGIIANPNCSTIQIVVPLKALHDAAGIRRLVISTYQSVSGTGADAMEELFRQSAQVLNMEEPKAEVYPHQIAFNCLPQIDVFDELDYTKEEWKMVRETRKIMEEPDMQISATAVRVPVFRGHSASINVELESEILPNEARALMSEMPGVVVLDDPERNLYPLATDAAGTDAIYVGRVRTDPTVAFGLNLWVVSDNLRKGAALNTIQIAECLIAKAHADG
ncbi:MAG: aspartate-semialdehyde dehydrogenase [Leptospirillia bacterium]